MIPENVFLRPLKGTLVCRAIYPPFTFRSLFSHVKRLHNIFRGIMNGQENLLDLVFKISQTQSTFICSKSTIETPEQCVKSVQRY